MWSPTAPVIGAGEESKQAAVGIKSPMHRLRAASDRTREMRRRRFAAGQPSKVARELDAEKKLVMKLKEALQKEEAKVVQGEARRQELEAEVEALRAALDKSQAECDQQRARGDSLEAKLKDRSAVLRAVGGVSDTVAAVREAVQAMQGTLAQGQRDSTAALVSALRPPVAAIQQSVDATQAQVSTVVARVEQASAAATRNAQDARAHTSSVVAEAVSRQAATTDEKLEQLTDVLHDATEAVGRCESNIKTLLARPAPRSPAAHVSPAAGAPSSDVSVLQEQLHSLRAAVEALSRQYQHEQQRRAHTPAPPAPAAAPLDASQVDAVARRVAAETARQVVASLRASGTAGVSHVVESSSPHGSLSGEAKAAQASLAAVRRLLAASGFAPGHTPQPVR